MKTWAFFLFFSLGVLPVFATQSKVTVDGRFDSLCRPWIGGGRRLCVISFYKLIASPEKYHGNYVQVHGFLGSVFGQLAIFPSLESYKNNVYAEAIALRPNGEIALKGVALKGSDGASVMVTGEFDAKYGGGGATVTPFLGAIKGKVIIAAPSQPH